MLERYFSGLGTGVTRSLKGLSKTGARSLSPGDLEVLLAYATRRKAARETRVHSEDVEAIARRVKALYLDCNQAAEKCVGRPLFVPTTRTIETLEFVLGRQVTDYGLFSVFVQRVQQVFWEQLDAKLRSTEGAYEIPQVAEYIGEGRLRAINALRIYDAHDLGGGQSDKDRKENAKHLRKVGALLRRLVGTEHIDRDNPEGWAHLHLAVLRELQEILGELRERLKQASSLSGAADPASPTEPGSFVYRE